MKRCLLIMTALILLLSAGCGSSGQEADSQYHAYYLNKENTRIVAKAYEPAHTDTEGMIDEMITLISTDAGSVEYRKPLPDQVHVVTYTYDGNRLSIYFDEANGAMDVAEEVLCRTAIVRTMVQIPEVSCVAFYVGDSPLSDHSGNVVGLMTDESFVENPGEQINSIQTATIKLYFANAAGDGLVEEEQEVSYISNISMEKLIMEHLLTGPKTEGLQSAIPNGTKLVSVTTTNGICYVNLDEGFLNQSYEIQEPIVIYSIVDSLSEIPTVNKVQISVNGNTTGVYRDSFALDTLYERNLDYVTDPEDAATERESELPVE